MPHIPLTDWAAARNHSPTLARRWAAAGRLATAVKRGRDWHVAPDDEPTPGQRGPKLTLPPVPDLSTTQAPNVEYTAHTPAAIRDVLRQAVRGDVLRIPHRDGGLHVIVLGKGQYHGLVVRNGREEWPGQSMTRAEVEGWTG